MMKTGDRVKYLIAGIFAASLVSGLLVSCGKKDAPAEDMAAEASASASLIAEPPKPQAELPERTPGLWELTISEEGSEDQARTMRMCTDKATEAELGITGEDLSGERCQKTAVSQLEDGSWGILAECDMGSGGRTEMSGKITGDYRRNYVMTLRSQSTGAALEHMNRVVNLIIKGRRLGACTRDQRPGDVILSAEDGFNLYTISGKPVPN